MTVKGCAGPVIIDELSGSLFSHCLGPFAPRAEREKPCTGVHGPAFEIDKRALAVRWDVDRINGCFVCELTRWENRWLVAAEKKRLVQKPQIAPETSKKARLTSRGIRRLRKKLGLSQADLAKLLGASTQTVHMWETKKGPLRLRENTLAAVLSAREMGARDAKRRIAEMGTKKPVRKVVRRKRAKRR